MYKNGSEFVEGRSPALDGMSHLREPAVFAQADRVDEEGLAGKTAAKAGLVGTCGIEGHVEQSFGRRGEQALHVLGMDVLLGAGDERLALAARGYVAAALVEIGAVDVVGTCIAHLVTHVAEQIDLRAADAVEGDVREGRTCDELVVGMRPRRMVTCCR